MKDNNLMPEATELQFDRDHLYFVPLGGSGEFGVNLNLYTYQDQWLAVDCGMGFADFRMPGVDILLPDATFITERRKNLAGLLITHAHEDHIGAVPYLWPRWRCPIYCTAFTAAVLRRKFREFPECGDAEIHVIEPGQTTEIGPFRLYFIHVTHSIPEAVSTIIETDAGRILHSGDWNLDPRPVIDGPTDEKSFREFGKKGIAAYIGDSTNAEFSGRGKSESEVEAGLAALFGECKGRIAITIFSSNIGRIQSIAKAAAANDRSVVLIGRSLHNMVGAARECGYLQDIPDFIDEEDMGYLPHDKTVIIITGSQGEYRAALSRVARGESRDIKLGRGDTVIFSARPIPGNEIEINAVRNNLAAAGVKVILPDDTRHIIHASGHPYRDEIIDMFQWTRPAAVIPVHGERTQLSAQAHLARSLQIDDVIVPNNGAVIKLTPDKPEVVGHVPTGLLAVEANRIIPSDHRSISERRKLQFTGAVHATLVLDGRGELVTRPQLDTIGLIDPDDPAEQRFVRDIAVEIEDILRDMRKGDRKDNHFVHEEIRIGIRRHVNNVLGLKPATTVHIVRID